MPYPRFLLLSFASCFVWVLSLAGAGYVFHSAIYNLIGDFHELSYWLLGVVVAIVVLGIGGFYLAETLLALEEGRGGRPRGDTEVRAGRRGEAPRDQRRDTGDLIPRPLARATRTRPSRSGKAEGD